MSPRRLTVLIVMGAAGLIALLTKRIQSRRHEVANRAEGYRPIAKRIARRDWFFSRTDAPSELQWPPEGPEPAALSVDASRKRKQVSLGLAAMLLAVVIAFVAQWLLTPGKAVWPAIGLYAVALITALVGARPIDHSSDYGDFSLAPEQWSDHPPQSHGPTRRYAAIISLIAGSVSAVAMVYEITSARQPARAVPFWLAAMAFWLLATGFWTSFPLSIRRTIQSRLELAGVVAIVVVAFLFRFIDLTKFPIVVHGDDGAVGVEARLILSGKITNIFGLGWHGFPELGFLPTALSLRVFGDNLFGLRMTSVVEGTLAVAIWYVVAKRLFSVRIAALSALILAMGQVAIGLSRVGIQNIQALLISVLLLYFLLRGLEKNHILDFLIAGFLVGFSGELYFAARATVIVIGLYLLYRAIREPHFVGANWRGFLVLVAGAVIAFAPLGLTYLQDPNALLHAGSPTYLDPQFVQHEFGVYHTHSIPYALWQQFIRTIGAFNLLGETSDNLAFRGPLLDFWSSALTVLGLGIVTARLKRAEFFLIWIWIWFTLLVGSVPAGDALFAPHLVAMLAVLSLLPAITVDYVWRGFAQRFGPTGNRMFTIPIVVLLILIGYGNYVGYFVLHPKMQPSDFQTTLAQYLETTRQNYRAYALAGENSLDYPTIQFLVPNLDGVNVHDRPLPLPIQRVPFDKGIVFIVGSGQDPRLAALKATYPSGVEAVHLNSVGFPVFYSFTVANRELLALAPGAVIDHSHLSAAESNHLPPIR